MANVTSDKLTPMGKKILEAYKKLAKKPCVIVGILNQDFEQAKKSQDKSEVIKITLGDVAVINEFGAPDHHIPERSFIRSTFDEKSKEWSQKMKEYKKLINKDKMTLEKALSEIGEQIRGDIIDKIINLDTPPNAQSTIRAKGSSNPLVDTGQLKGSIKYRVEL